MLLKSHNSYSEALHLRVLLRTRSESITLAQELSPVAVTFGEGPSVGTKKPDNLQEDCREKNKLILSNHHFLTMTHIAIVNGIQVNSGFQI